MRIGSKGEQCLGDVITLEVTWVRVSVVEA